ncbi:Ig-like domain-containing protein [Alkalihalobacillus sp. MEB130]|uniref:Ig-like domain-containing protein n=1 Tax=Alkalihalobacillus sp. MEB130 TaxID=2976704 RepID=UPI0028E077DD|nr:Ig-like domain-containing protein [Alkalihalobacillus sp. MEB130]MDT8858876.1 Ig-like domain-containing protein [Alkalihalobacillus sp. MEB130]
MKNKLWIKILMLITLLLPLGISQVVQAESTSSLSNGTYIVGKDLSTGLHTFTISKGSASIQVSRGTDIEFYESIESNKFDFSNQFTINLKSGDEIEIYKFYGASNVSVKKVSKVDLSKVSLGFYEVGTDIPAGTYTVTFDKPAYGDDLAFIDIYDQYYNEKDFHLLFADDDSIELKVSKGDKLYLSMLIGTLHFKEKVLIPQSITVNKSKLSLMVNRSEQLTATVHPATATNKSITWTSSHPNIATVDSKGNVKAIKAGSATITATAKGNTSVTTTIPVTVTNIVPTDLKVSKSTYQITKNQTVKPTITVSPSDAANKNITWKSSNTKVATVDSKGNIKGISNGTATITATAEANTNVSKKINVTVSTKTVKLNKTSLSITAGQSETLKATVSPVDSVEQAVKWKSSNTKVATVDNNGKVTGKAKGTATITATVKDAKDASAKVTVTAPVAAKSIKLDKTSATLHKGKTLTLSATISPSNTTDKTVKWKSSNTKVATVSSKGIVTAVNNGTAQITATTTNGKSSSMTVTVPYVKNLSAGTWKAGRDLPEGRYKITTTSGSGNLIIGMGTNRFVNEILSSSDNTYSVKVVTTDIKSGDEIEIMGLNSVQFTKVSNVKSNTLHAGYWTVGKDINAGRYQITTPRGSGNLIIYRGNRLLVNEILSNKSDSYTVTSVTTTLNSGDRIQISGLNQVNFKKK